MALGAPGDNLVRGRIIDHIIRLGQEWWRRQHIQQKKQNKEEIKRELRAGQIQKLKESPQNSPTTFIPISG
jgi:hypothetical protein